MELIQTSKKHACIRKLYALSKDAKKDLEIECNPCISLENLDEKYKNSYNYCKRWVHGLEYYPPSCKKTIFCLEAKNILKKFVSELNADVVFYKGGIHEKNICKEIDIDSFNIEQIGVKKVSSHDPREELFSHYKQINNIINNNF